MYLTEAWREHGWQLWDNFWYAGRYAQVNYSLLFYPFAALLGTPHRGRGLVRRGGRAFAALLRRRWAAIATGPAVAFALLVPLAVAAGTYPFLLGLAIALGSLVALAAGRRALALLGRAGDRSGAPARAGVPAGGAAAVGLTTPGWWRSRGNQVVAAGAVAVAGLQALLLRGFEATDAHYPFDPKDAIAIAGFCLAGLLLTRGLPDQRPLRALFLVYAGLGALAFVLSSPLGGNVVRLLLLMGARCCCCRWPRAASGRGRSRSRSWWAP